MSNNVNYMLGASYGTRLNAPQDACWDTICPLNLKSANPAQEKLKCLKNNLSGVCDCCKTGGLPDCKVLVPGQGLVDPCKLLSESSGGAKGSARDHFCDCVKEVCPKCQSRDAFLKNQQDVVDCCQKKCTSGSCNYDCNQIGLSYLAPNSLMGSCLPEETPPPPPPPPTPVTKAEKTPSFFDKNKTEIFIIIGLIVAIIIVVLVGLWLKNSKKRGRKSHRRR